MIHTPTQRGQVAAVRDDGSESSLRGWNSTREEAVDYDGETDKKHDQGTDVQGGVAEVERGMTMGMMI